MSRSIAASNCGQYDQGPRASPKGSFAVLCCAVSCRAVLRCASARRWFSSSIVEGEQRGAGGVRRGGGDALLDFVLPFAREEVDPGGTCATTTTPDENDFRYMSVTSWDGPNDRSCDFDEGWGFGEIRCGGFSRLRVPYHLAATLGWMDLTTDTADLKTRRKPACQTRNKLDCCRGCRIDDHGR
jgi:hypothetical protein